MNRRLIFISTLFCGLALSNCSGADKQSGNAGKAPGTGSEKIMADVEPVPNTAAQVIAKREVPVLCYHRIEDGKKGDYTVSTATFAAQMKILADSGYQSVSPAQLYDYLVFNKSLPEKPVIITFDDSRAEHFSIAAPVMEKNGLRGVFFIMTITYNKKNYMTTDQIAMLAKAGHTIGLHSWDHTMVTKYKEAEVWQKQVVEARQKLEKITGSDVDYWAYPYGIFDHDAAKELGKYFKISFILASKRDSLLPLQTVRRISIPEYSPQSMIRTMQRSFNKPL